MFKKGNNSIYVKYIKRILDIICALLAIIIFSWLYLIIALLVLIFNGRPIIFVQPRPGKDGKIFNLYKFRTMNNKKDKEGKLLPDSERLTSFGKKLRSSSLDELPEAFNILKGDMSVVGPRPLLVEYLDRYNDFQKRRHEIRPGLSGYAQINGRNTISWQEKFKYDVYYVDNVSFIFDLKIIYNTIKIALKREGINSTTNVTMEEFTGNN